MVRLIVVGNALEDLQRVLDAGLRHRHRLEAPLQRRVLLDILAVFVEGGGSDDLDLPTGQGGLEDVGGVHAALGISGPHDVVYLVDDQNDVAQLADLLDEPLHAALELSPELGTGHQSRQVQQIDLLVPQLEGDLPGGDALGQSLGNGSLAHAGFTDEAGIVLLPAVQDLHHPLYLLLPADNGVQLALSGPAAEVDAVVIQILVLLLALAGLLAGLPLRGLSLLCRGIVAAAEEPVQEGEGGGLAALLILVAVLGWACATSPSSSAPPKACIISLLRFSRSSGVMPIRFIMSSTCGRPSWAAHFRQSPSLTGSPFSFIREINTTATFFLHLEQSVGCIVLLRYRVDFTGITGLQ